MDRDDGAIGSARFPGPRVCVDAGRDHRDELARLGLLRENEPRGRHRERRLPAPEHIPARRRVTSFAQQALNLFAGAIRWIAEFPEQALERPVRIDGTLDDRLHDLRAGEIPPYVVPVSQKALHRWREGIDQLSCSCECPECFLGIARANQPGRQA